MKEEELTKVISDVVIAFEKAGVKDETLKESIDNLFLLKDILNLKHDEKNHCHYCRYYDKPFCSKISGIAGNEIEIVGQSPINGRIKFKVNPWWSCRYFMKHEQNQK